MTRIRVRRSVGPLVMGLLMAMALAVSLQAQPAGSGQALLQELRARVEDRFQLLGLRDSIVLVPKTASDDYRNVEITDDGGVVVDGAPVTGRELRSRLPEREADLVVRLSMLGPSDRRSLVRGTAGPATAPPGPESPEVTPAPPQPQPVPPAPSERAERRERHGGARVRVGGDVWVREGDRAGDAVVVVLGTARIDGRVDGDVVVVGGDIKLGPEASVQGNVVAVGGEVDKADGARVFGDLNEVRVAFPNPSSWFRRPHWSTWQWWGDGFGPSAHLFGSLTRMSLLALVTLLIVAVMATPVRRVAGVIEAEPWRAGLTGLAAQVFFVPVFVLSVVVLAISIIGIPLLLLVPFALLALVFASFLGFAGAACALGRLVARRAGNSRLTLLALCVVGLAVIWGLTVVARIVGLAGFPLGALMSVVLVVGFLIEYLAWTTGLGAVLITRFGRRGDARFGADEEVPPPPPAYDTREPFVDV